MVKDLNICEGGLSLRVSKRKALVPIIAILLLLGISVVGGVAFFVWVSGIVGNTLGTALPSAESLRLMGYDARDAEQLTGFSIINNTPDQKLAASSSDGDFIVLLVSNAGLREIFPTEIEIMAVSHGWDVNADVSTAPIQSMFEVYEGFGGDPAVDKTEPVLASSEDGRIVIHLGHLPGDEIKLGIKVIVKIKTEQGSTFNFTVRTGDDDRASLTSQSSQGQLTCNGLQATIVGTLGDDNLTGTPGDDVIVGLGGNDMINGNDGDDVICGGDGDDNLHGNNGADTIFGDGGNDDIHGNNDDDTIFGGDGADELRGENGNDVINGGGGNDDIDGSFDNDILNGDAGNDSIDGGPGNDTCDGGPGSDFLTSC